MNIYVSNLSYDVSDSDLKALFEAKGTVTSSKVITDRDSGRSRGFGFVEMSNNAEATKAISELHNTEFRGKVLNVNEAKPRATKPRDNRW
jgi:RNA recognition motif-containing protein